MARYRSFRDFDWPLLIITLIICALGVLQIYSATHDYQTSTHDFAAPGGSRSSISSLLWA